MLSRPAVASSLTVQPVGLRQHQRQRPRPERRGEPRRVGVELRELSRRGDIGHMRDQRIEGRPALGLIKPRHRRAIGGVGTEPIDRLGREGDEPAGRENAHRVAGRGGTGRQNAGHYGGCHRADRVPK